MSLRELSQKNSSVNSQIESDKLSLVQLKCFIHNVSSRQYSFGSDLMNISMESIAKLQAANNPYINQTTVHNIKESNSLCFEFYKALSSISFANTKFFKSIKGDILVDTSHFLEENMKRQKENHQRFKKLRMKNLRRIMNPFSYNAEKKRLQREQDLHICRINEYLEEFEEKRLNITKDTIRNFIIEYKQKLRDEMNSLDAVLDCIDKSSKNSEKNSPPTVPLCTTKENSENTQTLIKNISPLLSHKTTLTNKNSNPFDLEISQVYALAHNKNRDIPKILSECTRHILSNGTEEIGIFRVSGDRNAINLFLDRVKTGEYKFNSADSCHTAAAVLKIFLKRLLSPLVPVKVNEKCSALGEKLSQNAKREFASGEEDLEGILSQIPPLNLRVLKFISKFFVEMAKHEKKTKMSLLNYSIVMTPSLIRYQNSDDLAFLIGMSGSLNAFTHHLLLVLGNED